MKDYPSIEYPRMHGFTLIDLMIALSILMLSLSLGIPSLTSMVKKTEGRALKTSISSTLHFGRSYSLSSGKVTTVCGIDENHQCVRENFNKLAVFLDKNENKTLDDEEQLLLVNQLHYDGELKLSASLGKKYISFDYQGYSKQAGSFIFCSPKFPETSARITVSMPGRIYIARDSDNDGITELTNGDNIEC